MYTLINTNSKGTLERIEEFPVMSSDTVLYTSNTAGESDSFRIVYTLQPSIEQVAGSYFGRLQYILMPIDSTQDQEVKTLNMYADLTNEGAIEISTDTGFKTIRISSSDLIKTSPQYPKVNISVKGNLGCRYRIYQRLSESLIKSTSVGKQFDLSTVTYQITDAKSITPSKKGDLAELKTKSLVYASDDLGSSNEISIAYEPTNLFTGQQADFYTGAINYYLELDRTSVALEEGFIDSVNAEFEVEPIFRIVATSVDESGETIQEGGALLRFGEVGYKTGAKESRVKVTIESNLDKPYLVTQKLSGPLENEEGDKIPEELFTFVIKKEKDTEATIKFTQDTVIEPDKDVALFVSNSSGDSDEFEITYKLKVTPDTRGGDYATGISYSLSEL